MTQLTIFDKLTWSKHVSEQHPDNDLDISIKYFLLEKYWNDNNRNYKNWIKFTLARKLFKSPYKNQE